MKKNWKVFRLAGLEIANLSGEDLDCYTVVVSEVYFDKIADVESKLSDKEFLDYLNNRVFSDPRVINELERLDVPKHKIGQFEHGKINVDVPSTYDEEIQGKTESEQTSKARVRLAGTDLQAVEELVETFVNVAKSMATPYSGPVPLPTKRLVIPTRKSPNGEGRASWDHWEMRVHKRLVDIDAHQETLKQLMRIDTPINTSTEIVLL